MQASAGCWEDTISQVERMMRRANTCPGNAQCLEHCGPPVQEIPAAPPSYPLILDRDPVPEELEWEAYVSDSDSDGEGRGSWSDILSPEERERQRREREESRRVLSELKAVLGFRASEGERMKRKQLLFNDQAAVTLSAHAETSDPATDPSDAPASLGPAETNAEEGNHLSEFPAGSEGEEEEGKDGRVRPDPAAEPVTEFICGLEAKEGELGGASVCTRGGGGASELHQYDGVLEEGEGQNGLDCFLMRKVPAVSVMDRLTEIHGPEALSFSSALAAQVAARSHSLVNMEEQTFGDDEEEEEEEEEEESDRRAPEKD
ncbi:Vezatin [Nibea albiflora]|uniref:Vezatin n=1 Tax=Nibea albiflora TaxID=240163 RepID=A0ACB7ETJ4_NIBAL|nr:Vezatin [Nibea albiflora]